MLIKGRLPTSRANGSPRLFLSGGVNIILFVRGREKLCWFCRFFSKCFLPVSVRTLQGSLLFYVAICLFRASEAYIHSLRTFVSSATYFDYTPMGTTKIYTKFLNAILTNTYSFAFSFASPGACLASPLPSAVADLRVSHY